MSKESRKKSIKRKRKRKKGGMSENENVVQTQGAKKGELILLYHASLDSSELREFFEDIEHSEIFQIREVLVQCSGRDVCNLKIVHIHASHFYHEMVIYALEEGWMSKRWKDRFIRI